MEPNLLDKMLTSYRDRGDPVTIQLQNRARISGKVRAFDNYVILLENHRSEIVYRHAVSSLAVAALQEERTAPQRTEQPRPAPRAAAYPKPSPRQNTPRPAPKAAAAPAEPALNTTMKEGLLRWMQEQKASK